MMARHLQRDVREDLVGPVPQPRLRVLVREDPEPDVNVFHLLEGNPESESFYVLSRSNKICTLPCMVHGRLREVDDESALERDEVVAGAKLDGLQELLVAQPLEDVDLGEGPAQHGPQAAAPWLHLLLQGHGSRGRVVGHVGGYLHHLVHLVPVLSVSQRVARLVGVLEQGGQLGGVVQGNVPAINLTVHVDIDHLVFHAIPLDLVVDGLVEELGERTVDLFLASVLVLGLVGLLPPSLEDIPAKNEKFDMPLDQIVDGQLCT